MQNIGQTYKDYKKELPKYEAWKKQRDIRNAKKEYLFKTKPPSEEELKRAKAKADILFNAIDVMDDYSQEKAEDVETIIALSKQGIQKPIDLACFAGAIGLSCLKGVKNLSRKILSKTELFAKDMDKPLMRGFNITFTDLGAFYGSYILLSLIAGLTSNIAFSLYSAKLEVEASKAARFEAMQSELNDFNQFALLNDEQKNEVNNIAKNIQLNKEEKQSRKLKSNYDMFNFSKPIQTIQKFFEDKKKINEQQKNYFDIINNEIKANYDRKLTKEEIIEAKKDKELLTSMIENIDIKSQDYAENTEFITEIAAIGLALSMPILTAPLVFLISKIPNKLLNTLASATIPMASFLLPLIYLANIEKLSSKIARYKAIEEMKQNPANFVYYSEEEINSVDESKINVKKEEKDNIFKFIPKIIKEYKEYKKYVKENDEKDKKYNKALKQIEISKEQEKEAAKFQRNTFLTFNKIDDNSQKYSENIEAQWEIKQTLFTIGISCLSLITSGLILSKMPFKKMLEAIKDVKNNKAPKNIRLKMTGLVTSFFGTISTPIICSALSTKEQKQASRVANYKAIEELKDYQNFA